MVKSLLFRWKYIFHLIWKSTLDYTSLYQKCDYSLFLSLHLSLSLLPLLACTYLNNAQDLVLRALPLSVCLFKMNRFMYSPIVSRFKSICKMTKCKSKPGLDHSSIMTRNLYKHAQKKKNITGVHLETKQMHWYILGSVSASLFQLKQLWVTF